MDVLMNRVLAGVFLIGVFAVLNLDMAGEGEAIVTFNMERGTLLVEAFYSSDDGASEEVLDYTLEVLRDGTGGVSTTTQTGSFSRTPAQVDTLSRSRVSVGEGDQVEVTLTVCREDEMLDRKMVRCRYPDCDEPINTNSRP